METSNGRASVLRRALLSCLIISASLALPAAVRADPPAPNIPHWLAGNWDGTGQQSNGASWSMRLMARALKDKYSVKISYPSLKCGGHWTLVQGDDKQARFVEHITFGTDQCIDGGAVTLGLAGSDTLTFHWEGGRLTASGQLTREQH